MRVSWNWLQDFVDLQGLEPKDVADKLTLAGLEVEGVEYRGHNLQGVVVARVEAREQHPDADRLSVCTVFDGENRIQVVCGAKNVEAGVVVPLATVGTTMPGGLKIKKSKLRGVESHGMLCSADELGMSSDVDGLLLLDPTLEIGRDIADALQLRDVILDISLTPDRGDCLSVRGVAREIAVLLGRPLREAPLVPTDLVVASSGESVDSVLTVTVEATERCASYNAAVLRGVQVAPSPLWMQRRLESVGQRPINNIVDVTNYVNLEFGQPVHAFDLQKLQGNALVVRQAKEGETLETLDGKNLKLVADDLVIADAERPVALAGVMGGANSQVSDETTAIVLEVASFDGGGVRRSARRAHLHTESSHRFERGTDATAIPTVVARAVQLFAATQPDGVVTTQANGTASVVSKQWNSIQIPLTLRDLKRIIGIDYTVDEVHTALRGLGFGVEGTDTMIVDVPPRRPDVTRTIDLVEEVGRVIGYDRLPNELPRGAMGFQHTRRDDAPVVQDKQPVVPSEHLDAVEALRQALFSAGANEAVNWAIGDAGDMELLRGVPAANRLINPLSSDRSVMRTTLLAGLLRNVKWNLSRRADRVSLFEIAHVFPEEGASRAEGDNIAGVLVGRRDLGWHTSAQQVDVWDLTAQLTVAARALSRPVSFRPVDAVPAWLHPQAGAAVYCGEELLGYAGQLHPLIARTLDISAPVFAFELNMEAWLHQAPVTARDVRVPRTLVADRDLALVLDTSLSFHDVSSAIAGFSHPLVATVRLFDVYAGSNLPEGKRSLAFRVSYRHDSESLTDAQIDEAHQAFTNHLTEITGASRRG